MSRILSSCLLLFCLICPFSGDREAADADLVSLSGKAAEISGLRFELDEAFLLGKLEFKGRLMTFTLGEKFRVNRMKVKPLKHQVVLQKGEVFVHRSDWNEIAVEFGFANEIKSAGSGKKTVSAQNPAVTAGDEEEEEEITPAHPEKEQLDFIVIDAGHGGHDPGAFGLSGSVEKEITLKAAVSVAARLKREFPGTRIFLTRSRDSFVSLDRRAEKANQLLENDHFGIFISLHCNATLSVNTRGFEIYYLARTPSNEEARKVMARENGLVSAQKNIGRHEAFLMDSQIQAESKMLATQLENAFLSEWKDAVKSRGIRKADFAVLRGSMMPAVLVEMGYITNRKEARILKSDAFRQDLASGISAGIRKFLKKKPGI